MSLALTLMVVSLVFARPNKERKDKGTDPSAPSKRAKIFNWDFTILGHRGGASGFIPEHSIMSYTIGAQHGADYIEPDITFTSDGIQILQHHPNLADATNVPQIYDTNSPKYTPDDAIEYYWRTNDEGGPSIHPYKETTGGYFSWDFTYRETQNLSLIADDLSPSPFDKLQLKIMRLEELLLLVINELSPTLSRPIGIIPELKYPHEFTKRLGKDVELLHLEILAQYGYLRKENDYFYVKTLCELATDIGLIECDEAFYGNKPAVILQSFNAPSLKVFKQYTDAPLVYLGWYNYDLMDKVFVDWVKTFADGLGVNSIAVEKLKNILQDAADDGEDTFAIFEYTLGYDVEAYFDTINSGIINAVFTDDTDTARVIQETLDYISENNIKIVSDTQWIFYVAFGVVWGIFITLFGFGVIYLLMRWNISRYVKYDKLETKEVNNITN